MKRSLFALFSFIFLVAIFPIQNAMAISFSWVGNYSSEWENPQNWSPSTGYPDSVDFVTISSGTYNLQLHQNRKISNLTLSSKTIDLNGYSLTVYGTATFTSGTVTGGTLYLRGNLAAFNGTTFGGPVDADCGYIRFSGSTFNSTVSATDNGVATGTGSGGCTFNGDLHIIHKGTGTYFTLANTTGDLFNANVKITNNSDHEVFLSTSGISQFKGNIVLESTSTGGISWGSNGGTSTMDSAKTLSIGSAGFSADVLTLKNFTQAGNTAQVLTLTGSALLNIISSTFNGNLTVTSPGFLLKNSIFNGETIFIRNGTANHQSDGGNVFNGNVSFSNNGSSGRLRLATTTADTYNANATFNSSGQDVQVAYLGENLFKGDITINSNKVVFNTSTGKVTFTGSNNQSLNGSYNFPFKKLAINKASGTVTANTTLSVDDSLILVKGNLITSSTNLLTMKPGSKTIGASNLSFVEGPMKKTGNTAFIYPIGKNSSYRPLEISAPSTTTSEFTGEYIEDSVMVNSDNRDSTLAFLFRNKYWSLERNSGTSNVFVTLSWSTPNAVIDTFIAVAAWNGSQWKDLGHGIITGDSATGTIKSNTTSAYYNEFTIGFRNINTLQNIPNCSTVQSAGFLRFCLVHTFTGTVSVISNITINNSSTLNNGFFPMPIHSGVILEGLVGGSTPKWWQPNCPLISSDHTAEYDVDDPALPIHKLYLFSMQPGATIQNLRIRGANLDQKDFNDPKFLCGAIYADGAGAAAINIINCEIFGFSQAGIWKNYNPDLMNITNCYIHKVKGRSRYGIGYGVWLKSDQGPNLQEVNITNTIFDDCKAAIDGQAQIVNWNINKCTLSQFFQSEDINSHNDNRFEMADCPCAGQTPNYLNHWTYSYSTGGFYGKYWSNSLSCVGSCQGSTNTTIPGQGYGNLTGGANLAYYTNPINPDPLSSNEIPIHDVGGSVTSIQNSIFHKKWRLGTNGNINLSYPNLDNARGGFSSNNVNVSHNTFTTDKFDKDEVLTTAANNSGYAKIANNYIEADIWSIDGTHIIKSDNSFSYQPSSLVTAGAPQPHELSLELNDGTNVLSTGYSLSPLSGHKYIQYVDVNTAFNLEASITNASGSAESYYVIRPNPNDNGPITGSADNVISSENYFLDSEEKLNGSTVTTSITYNKPGLYGIDVLGFDAHDYGAPDHYNFKASSWQHIPVIVKGTQEQMLYFNIKDSYHISGAALTGVKKQAYLNDLLIWEEDIAQGGDGWELVEIDLKDFAPNTTTKILSALHTDGSPNVLSFSIYMEYPTLNNTSFSGVQVYVDDIYIPKTGSIAGDNLVKDGSVELSKENLCSECYWFQNLADQSTGDCGNTHVSINSIERKSGSQSLYLEIPFTVDGCTFNSLTKVVASVGTYIDFTDLLSCADYTLTNFPNYNGFQYLDQNYVDNNSVLNFSNQIIRINSNLNIVGKTLKFEGCLVVIESDEPSPVSITIQGTTSTLIVNPIGAQPTHFFGCQDMWQGIINNGGDITLATAGNACIFEDAIEAIESTGGNVNIRYAKFNNNRIGIQLINYNQSPSNTSTTDGFLGIEFSNSDSILTKAPFDGKQSVANIDLINVLHVSFGGFGSTSNTPTAYKNKFADAIFGIRSQNSTAEIFNNEFTNIGIKNEICRLCEGAIYATDESNLLIGGMLSGTTGNPYFRNYFENCNVGIITKGVNDIDVKGNRFDKIGKAFIAHNASISNITINENNEFYNVDNGIIARELLGNVAINGNSFNATSVSTTDEAHYNNTAITLQNYNDYATTHDVIVSGNNITDCRIGIHALNIPNLSIGADVNGGTGNSITFNKEKGFYHCGIWIENCTSANVQDNEIIKVSGEFLLEGINTTESADALINMNTITSADVPVHVFGSCLETEFHCNVIDNLIEPGAGIFLDFATLPFQGVDDVPDQTWENEWKGYSSSVYGITGAPIQPLTWYYNPTDAKFHPNPDPVTGLIDPQPLTGPETCAVRLNNDFILRDIQYGLLVNDSIDFEEYFEEFSYKSKNRLFELIKSDTSILTLNTALDSTFANFYEDVSASNIGLFKRVDSLIAVGNLSAANTLNSSINDVNTIEFNSKTVNNIIVNKVLVDSALNATDSTTLEEIAYQSPLSGGPAVYRARAILFMEIHDEQVLSRLSKPKKQDIIRNESIGHVTLFPNPANQNCLVAFKGFESNFIMILRNSVGETILLKHFQKGEKLFNLNTNSIAPGIYFLFVYDTENIFEVTKLIINH